MAQPLGQSAGDGLDCLPHIGQYSICFQVMLVSNFLRIAQGLAHRIAATGLLADLRTAEPAQRVKAMPCHSLLLEYGSGAEGAATVREVFGDAEKAGRLFEKVKGAVGGEAVPVTDEMSQAAMRASELAERGAEGLPRVITRFIQRVTDPDKPEIAWNGFRDFMSNVSRLSANEYSSMNPQMAAQVSKLAGAMKDAAQGVAEAGGVGDDFSQAMQLYARSKACQKFGAEVWAGFKRAILPGAAGSGGYQAGKRLSDLM